MLSFFYWLFGGGDSGGDNIVWGTATERTGAPE